MHDVSGSGEMQQERRHMNEARGISSGCADKFRPGG